MMGVKITCYRENVLLVQLLTNSGSAIIVCTLARTPNVIDKRVVRECSVSVLL